MLYDPDWLSLLDARERLKAKGVVQAEAETAICLAARDEKLKTRNTIEKVTYARTGATLSSWRVRALEFEDGNKLRLAPFNEKPQDIDWDNSRPLRPRPYGPWQHQLLAHVALIEVSREDLERTFPMLRASAPGDAGADGSPTIAFDKELEQPSRLVEGAPIEVRQREASPTRSAPRSKFARLVVDELFPEGVPNADELPNPDLIDAVRKQAKGRNVGGRDTILRVTGRRRK